MDDILSDASVSHFGILHASSTSYNLKCVRVSFPKNISRVIYILYTLTSLMMVCIIIYHYSWKLSFLQEYHLPFFCITGVFILTFQYLFSKYLPVFYYQTTRSLFLYFFDIIIFICSNEQSQNCHIQVETRILVIKLPLSKAPGVSGETPFQVSKVTRILVLLCVNPKWCFARLLEPLL